MRLPDAHSAVKPADLWSLGVGAGSCAMPAELCNQALR